MREMTWRRAGQSRSVLQIFHIFHVCLCFARPSHLRELLSKLVQFLLQGRLLLLGGSHLVTDLTDLSGHPGGHGDTSGFSSSDVGSLDDDLQKLGSASQLFILILESTQVLVVEVTPTQN